LTTPMAQAGYYVDGSMFVTSPTGISCARPGTTGTWTCQIPNGNGGFATLSGIAGSDASDAVATANAWAATNLGADALVLGNENTQAGASSVAVGAGSSARIEAVAIGRGANADHQTVAIGYLAG